MKLRLLGRISSREEVLNIWGRKSGCRETLYTPVYFLLYIGDKAQRSPQRNIFGYFFIWLRNDLLKKKNLPLLCRVDPQCTVYIVR